MAIELISIFNVWGVQADDGTLFRTQDRASCSPNSVRDLWSTEKSSVHDTAICFSAAFFFGLSVAMSVRVSISG
jgi:hypothetical protein